ncbi:LANO_0G04544g1_1 [Lachancea nothofagi CBS 11611]|uniref:LANO_0G04544g1_1 n=1 Tax=Lachancea nothofagi CBS 11611 TaxID=1266666 RepID=A0A1G4KG62_9SACH|nr:LANO_0G04544g1_1 [Lachancea nothofagi CBS 11611]
MSNTKIALVTGASSGIGYELTKQLAQKGYKVYAAARRIDRMKPLETEFPGLVVAVKLDVSEPKEIAALKDRLQTELPSQKLDILYNNAGQSCTSPASDVSNEVMEMAFKVNVFGPINLCRELLPFVINARGTVVFTGSIAGLISFPFGSVYSATKGAIHSYASGLHIEMKPFGVRVLNVVTGGVATEIADKRPIPADSIYSIPEAADALQYRRDMVKSNKPMNAAVYVSQVLKDVASSRDPVEVYHGTFSTIAYYLAKFMPYWLLEKVLEHKFKLSGMTKALQKSKRQ